MKRKYSLYQRDVILTTILTFVIIGLLSLLFYNTKFLNPIYKALNDFELTDIYYAAHRSKTTEYSEQIVLVNIGESDRAEITKALARIATAQPKVLGIDITFPERKNEAVDLELKKILSKNNIVLASQMQYAEAEGKTQPASQLKSHAYFNVEAKEGFGNFIGDANTTVRYYCPSFISEQGDSMFSFSSKVLQTYDPKKYALLSQRKQATEIINFGLKKFLVIEIDELLKDANLLQFLKGKCVLMGYMGKPNGAKVLDDLHVTPINKNFGGVSIPDTYGVEIHANIIHMALSQQFINESSPTTKWVIIVVLTILHLYLFTYFYVKKHLWFHIVAKTAQIISFGLLALLSISCYHWFNYKIEPAILLIAVILSVDALYFMEAILVYANKRKGWDSYFTANHH